MMTSEVKEFLKLACEDVDIQREIEQVYHVLGDKCAICDIVEIANKRGYYVTASDFAVEGGSALLGAVAHGFCVMDTPTHVAHTIPDCNRGVAV